MGDLAKAVFLDRDGTLNLEKHYLSKPEELELFEGVPESLSLLQSAGMELFVVTNQSGCLLYTSPSPRDLSTSRMPSSA